MIFSLISSARESFRKNSIKRGRALAKARGANFENYFGVAVSAEALVMISVINSRTELIFSESNYGKYRFIYFVLEGNGYSFIIYIRRGSRGMGYIEGSFSCTSQG